MWNDYLNNPDFPYLYVYSYEYIKELNVVALKAARLFGNYSVPVEAKILGSEVRIDIVGQSFRPGRSGMEGKTISHMLQEGIWTVKTQDVNNLVKGFVVPVDCNLEVSKYSFLLEGVNLPHIQNLRPLCGLPIPIEVKSQELIGVLIFDSEESGQLFILSNSRVALNDQSIELYLINENVYSQMAFVILAEAAD